MPSADSSTTSSVISSAIYSAKLSSISKWLLKPPLLSKPPLLFKSPLLSKSALVLAPLLLLSYTQGIQALTAQTSREIEGSAPYLTFDGGRTKLTSTDSLLFIELPDGTRYTKSTNPSTPTNPIRLPNAGASFNDIKTIVPTSQSSITMNDLITRGNWGDDDGDGQGAGGVTASGNISLIIRDKDGSTVNRNDILNACSAPYKVTLTSTGGSLTTQYGVPRSSSFSRDRVDYYINPYTDVGVCYARPNLFFGGTRSTINVSFSNLYDDPRYAGPSNIWNPRKGFLVQSTSSSFYDRNFPTTGANGLYFDLDIGGIDASKLRWTVNTSGSIRATVSWTSPVGGSFRTPEGATYNVDFWISDRSKNVTRVTLHGPEARSLWYNSNPSRITVPSLPQTFELVGRDGSGNEVRYGFVLKQWFVNRGGSYFQSEHSSWCSHLGYRLARARDLTNAVFPSIPDVTPSPSGNHYMRYIGAGLLAEWGSVPGYVNTNFSYNGYFVSSDIHNLFVNAGMRGGDITGLSSIYGEAAICTTP